MSLRETKRPPSYGPLAALQNLSAEISATQGQIRNLIGHAHSSTDGAHMESVLRKALRQRLPRTLEVKHGFVVSDQGQSTQIDVLVIDSSRPRFFEDGDLVICGPEAVVGIIEVKASVGDFSEKRWTETLEKLNSSAKLCHNRAQYLEEPPPFVGLFALSGSRAGTKKGGGMAAQRACKAAATLGAPEKSAVNHLCVGSQYFCRLEQAGSEESSSPAFAWRSYCIENLAHGYFIGNLLMRVDELHVAEHRNRLFPINKSILRDTMTFPIE